MPKGGPQPGSGRPKGRQNQSTIDKAKAREALRAIVIQHMGELVSAQVANAKGLKYLVVRNKKSGKFERVSEAMARLEEGLEHVEIWEKEPSVAAFTDLMNRALDKPVEPHEVEHSGGIEVSWKGQKP